jgi:hypothetical protein
MKKIIYILILGISFLSCKKELKKENSSETETKMELKFCFFNATDYDLKNITIGLPDTTLVYDRIEKYSKTDWINVKSAYYYGFIRFYDKNGRKYLYRPIDYVGEKLYEKGEMKFIIKSIDSTKTDFEFESIYPE